MTGRPDAIWQELIDSYLCSLQQWQRIVSKASPGPGKAPTKTGMTKVNNAFTQMKSAEETLKKYEADMGY